jgi:hypothetical protein
MTYLTEFPDFTDMPAIPAGFEDTSWHNDACPRFENAALGLALWCDYADAADREHADGKRFLLCTVDDETLLATDDWNEVTAAINARTK